jgi:pyruvate-ferredoxin/flavodoxin oxidoreductase
MIAGAGDRLPVSALPVDGTFPTHTARWERRSIAHEIPIWDPEICIDCAKCALVCPHAAIRMKVFDPGALEAAPEGFKHKEWRDREHPGMRMTIQVAPDDCTGCGVCVDVCPARSKEVVKHKAIDMEPKIEHLDVERAWFEFFLGIAPADRRDVKVASIKGSQMLEPLFEFSGACAGCGETPYLKLLSQMYGDRLLVANATGCSSIYGGNLPTTPWSTDANGRGPAWANSLFEDNAEFGLGMRLALDHQSAYARDLLERLADHAGSDLARAILDAPQEDERQLDEPTRWSARASGSSAETGGRTTSGSAAWTTCSRADATSTSSCWTRRCTPTPAARHRRRRREAPSPSSPPGASRWDVRISGCSPRGTATSTWRRSRSAPTTPRR